MKTTAVLAKSPSTSNSGVALPAMWRTLLLLCSAALLVLSTNADQSGFISIDCGSTSNYTETGTGLFWTTDDGYISTGTNRAVKVQGRFDNTQQLSTARYFPQRRAKHCYILPVQVNSSYLVRAYFYFGDLEAAPPEGYYFNISIDSTAVAFVDSTTIDGNVGEYLVASGLSSQEIAFCIMPGIGNPFISSLELRPLAPGMYRDVMFQSMYINVGTRLDCGAASTDPDVRYPDDAYDRKWSAPGSTFTIDSNSTISTIGILAFDNPPLKVMQSAWEDPSFWFTLPTATAQYFYVAFFFAEIRGPNAANRTVNISLNGTSWFSNYVISDFGREVYYERDSIDGGTANFSISKTQASPLPALLNALEFHEVFDINTTVTIDSDGPPLHILYLINSIVDHFWLMIIDKNC